MSILIAGSQGEQKQRENEEAPNYGSFLKPGINFLELSPKTRGKIRLLPSFDYNLSQTDELFKTSTFSYRSEDKDDVDPDTNTPAFTGWYISLLTHKFFGNGNAKFLSPKNVAQNPKAKGVCPLQDIFYYCYNKVNREGAPSYRKYFDAKVNPEAYLKMPQTSVFMNALYVTEEEEQSQVVLVMTQTAFKALKETLSEKRDPDDEPITKEWPKYQYGDITSIDTGCWLYPVTIQTASKYHPGGLSPVTVKSTMEGYRPDYRDINDPKTIKILRNRSSLVDTDNVLDIWDYQRLTDFIVSDGGVPLDVIKHACGDYANIKEETKKEDTQTVKSTTKEPEQQESVNSESISPADMLKKTKSTSVTETPVTKESPSDDVMKKLNKLLMKMGRGETLSDEEKKFIVDNSED